MFSKRAGLCFPSRWVAFTSVPTVQEQEQALESACKVVLAPPGCIYLFSGCNAHAVINVGWTAPTADAPPARTVCLSSYEALCGLHPVHARAMIGTHDSKLHHPECWMDTAEDLEDFEEDVAFNISNVRGGMPVYGRSSPGLASAA